MNTLDFFKARRSIKYFEKNFTIPTADKDLIFQHMLTSPSSFNIQHWRFVQIEDHEQLRKIRMAAFDQPQITDASILLIICADIKAWNKNPNRYWQNATQDIQTIMINMMTDFYAGEEQLQRDEALRSVGIVAQTGMLAAKYLGYDSCPMIGFDSEKVAELINLPKDYLIGMILAIGKAAQPAHPKPSQLSLSEILIKNRF